MIWKTLWPGVISKLLKITQPTAVVKRNFIAHLLKDVLCVKISLFYSKIKSWENIQRFHKNITCGKSSKFLPWSLTVYKKDLVKLHCWDPHRCPEVPVVPWSWSPHCPENSTQISDPLAHLAHTFHHPEKRSENEDEGNRVYLRSTRSSNMSDC